MIVRATHVHVWWLSINPHYITISRESAKTETRASSNNRISRRPAGGSHTYGAAAEVMVNSDN
eukprot:scaffold5084_cov145-Skeletonema_menzelii.AAC.4